MPLDNSAGLPYTGGMTKRLYYSSSAVASWLTSNLKRNIYPQRVREAADLYELGSPVIDAEGNIIMMAYAADDMDTMLDLARDESSHVFRPRAGNPDFFTNKNPGKRKSKT